MFNQHHPYLHIYNIVTSTSSTNTSMLGGQSIFFLRSNSCKSKKCISILNRFGNLCATSNHIWSKEVVLLCTIMVKKYLSINVFGCTKTDRWSAGNFIEKANRDTQKINYNNNNNNNNKYDTFSNQYVF